MPWALNSQVRKTLLDRERGALEPGEWRGGLLRLGRDTSRVEGCFKRDPAISPLLFAWPIFDRWDAHEIQSMRSRF